MPVPVCVGGDKVGVKVPEAMLAWRNKATREVSGPSRDYVGQRGGWANKTSLRPNHHAKSQEGPVHTLNIFLTDTIPEDVRREQYCNKTQKGSPLVSVSSLGRY